MNIERTRQKALVALQTAEDAVIAFQLGTDPAAVSLYTTAATRFFPSENHMQFADRLKAKIFHARQQLMFAKIESANAMTMPPKYRHNGELFNIQQWRQISGVPAMAWPPNYIVLLKEYFKRSYNSLRPAVLAHEAFHLNFSFNYCSWSYMGQMKHVKGTTNDAFAYQGFVCQVSGLPANKPFTRYP